MNNKELRLLEHHTAITRWLDSTTRFTIDKTTTHHYVSNVLVYNAYMADCLARNIVDVLIISQFTTVLRKYYKIGTMRRRIKGKQYRVLYGIRDNEATYIGTGYTIRLNK